MDHNFTGIQKIAVLRATNLGDYIAAIPALEALRRTYPDAEIVYLGKPFHREIIQSRPGPADRAVIVPVSRGVRVEPDQPDLVEDPRALDTFFSAMQAEYFDLAIQMQGGGRNSNPFVQRLGARVAVGMKTPDAPALDRWMPYLFYQPESARLLELVRLVGAETCGTEPSFPITPADAAEVRAALPLLHSPYAVLHPGASDVRRRWPAERFAAVGDALARSGLRVVVTGVAHERAVVADVIRRMDHTALSACDRLSVGGLAALLAGASLVVSNDTGPMHLANAVGTPNVGIFWCGNAFNWSPTGRTRHRPLIAWLPICPLCGTDMMALDPPKTACQHNTCFVAAIPVQEVLAAAFDLLHYAAQDWGVPETQEASAAP